MSRFFAENERLKSDSVTSTFGDGRQISGRVSELTCRFRHWERYLLSISLIRRSKQKKTSQNISLDV